MCFMLYAKLKSTVLKKVLVYIGKFPYPQKDEGYDQQDRAPHYYLTEVRDLLEIECIVHPCQLILLSLEIESITAAIEEVTSDMLQCVLQKFTSDHVQRYHRPPIENRHNIDVPHCLRATVAYVGPRNLIVRIKFPNKCDINYY
ncbi:hypothetical protein ANN_14285 [Periplaneta americana]|uniref:Uncharacterized protein n=1 Tax=Periplaneta americana TaxID=6978 RepID=A0ABQ8SVW4_PERAM|nr:hypothetical protein ANN_14285 [Periplaneta americana]